MPNDRKSRVEVICSFVILVSTFVMKPNAVRR